MPFSPSIAPVPEWLQSKLELLSMSQEVSMVGCWEMEIDSDEVLWSNELFRIFEIAREENNYIKTEVVYSFIHPDDLDKVRQSPTQLMENELFEIDYRIITAENNLKHLHAWYRRISSRGEKSVIRGTVQDITKQRELEYTLRALNDELRSQNAIFHQTEIIGSSGHWQLNLQTLKCIFSQNFYRLLEIQPGTINGPEELISFVDEAQQEEVRKLIVHPEKDFSLTCKIKLASKRNAFFRWSGKLNVNSSGEKIFTCIILDITEEENLKQELVKRTSIADQLIELSAESVSVLSPDKKVLEWNPTTERLFGPKKAEVI
jgi:PAS domain-containing protein